MFFSSSLTVSMTTLLCSRIFLYTRMNMFIILLRTSVTSCIPLMKNISKRTPADISLVAAELAPEILHLVLVPERITVVDLIN